MVPHPVGKQSVLALLQTEVPSVFPPRFEQVQFCPNQLEVQIHQKRLPKLAQICINYAQIHINLAQTQAKYCITLPECSKKKQPKLCSKANAFSPKNLSDPPQKKKTFAQNLIYFS